MSFGNALAGFMQGFDPNRDFVANMKKQEIARRVKAEMQPMKAKKGMSFDSTADRSGNQQYNALWVSDDAKQQQQMLLDQERGLTHGAMEWRGQHPDWEFGSTFGKNDNAIAEPDAGVQNTGLGPTARYRAHTTDTNAPTDQYFDTEQAAQAYLDRYNSMPEQLRRVAGVYGQMGDPETMLKYNQQADNLEWNAGLRKRQKDAWGREDQLAETVRQANGNPEAVQAAYAAHDPLKAVQYGAAVTQLDDARTKQQAAAIQTEALTALKTGGLQGVADWYTRYPNGLAMRYQQNKDGSVIVQHVTNVPGQPERVVAQYPYDNMDMAMAGVAAIIRDNPLEFARLASTIDYQQGMLRLAQMKATQGAGGGAGAAAQPTMSLSDVNALTKLQQTAYDMVLAARGQQGMKVVNKDGLPVESAKLRHQIQQLTAYGVVNPHRIQQIILQGQVIGKNGLSGFEVPGTGFVPIEKPVRAQPAPSTTGGAADRSVGNPTTNLDKPVATADYMQRHEKWKVYNERYEHFRRQGKTEQANHFRALRDQYK